MGLYFALVYCALFVGAFAKLQGTVFAVGVLAKSKYDLKHSRLVSILQKFVNISVFTIVHDEKVTKQKLKKVQEGIYHVSVNSSSTRHHGYAKSRVVTAIDKALYFFAHFLKISAPFRCVWLIDIDVFIPSFTSFLNVNNLCLNGNADLILGPKSEFTYVIGMSRGLLDNLDKYAYRHKIDFSYEFISNFAQRNSLKVVSPNSLTAASIHNTTLQHTCRSISKSPMDWFYPIESQKEFVLNCISSGSWKNAKTSFLPELEQIPFDYFRHLPRSPVAFAVYMTNIKDIVSFEWLNEVQNSNITLFAVFDNPDYDSITKIDNIFYVFISSKVSEAKGFLNWSPAYWLKNRGVARNSTSGDKTMYFFCEFAVNYDFVWLIESDVFIPSMKSFNNVMLLSNSGADLIVAGDQIEDHVWGHWPLTSETLQLPHPWYRSMTNVLGFSKGMLNEVHQYIVANHRLEFEVIFNTLAHSKNMTILTPLVLDTLTVKAGWSCQEVSRKPLNWFHRMKNQVEFVGSCVIQGYWNRDWLS